MGDIKAERVVQKLEVQGRLIHTSQKPTKNSKKVMSGVTLSKSLKAYNNPDEEKAVEVAEKERSNVDRMVLEHDRSRWTVQLPSNILFPIQQSTKIFGPFTEALVSSFLLRPRTVR